MKNQFTTLFLFLLFACKGQDANKCLESDLFVSALSIDNNKLNVEGSNTFYHLLDNSDLTSAISLLNDLKTEYHNRIRYYALDGRKSKEEYYMLYRINEFVGEVNVNILMSILAEAYSADLDACEKVLLQIEHDYLRCLSLEKSESVSISSCLDSFNNYVKDYPQSHRIKYLFAKLHIQKKGTDKVSLEVLKNLLGNGYYEKPILDLLIGYYKNTNLDSLKMYTDFFTKAFPNICNLGSLFLAFSPEFPAAVKLDSTFKICLAGTSTRDSVVASVYALRLLLNKGEFKKIESSYANYNINDFSFIQDTIKLWERGEYYDIMLSSLFIQKKYKQFFSFLNKEVGLNNVVVVKNESDFIELVSRYYKKYIDNAADLSEIEAFYKLNFSFLTDSLKDK